MVDITRMLDEMEAGINIDFCDIRDLIDDIAELKAEIVQWQNAVQSATVRAEGLEDYSEKLSSELAALKAESKRLRSVLTEVREACFFDDDDGQIGVSEDVVISPDLFNQICEALKGGDA